MGANRQGSARFAELDGLRGVAAFAVLVGHYTYTFDAGIGGQPQSSVRFLYGNYGVQLFFLISGFVILMTAWRAKRPSDFAISRVSRLYPAYWISLAIAVIAAFAWSAIPDPSLSGLAINVSMVQRWFLVSDINDVTWTLAIEMQFYLLVLALLVITGSKLSKRVVLVAMSTWVSVGVVVALVLGPAVRGVSPDDVSRMAKIILNVTLAEYAPLFAAGCFAYLSRQRLLSIWWPVVTTALAVAVAGSLHGLTAAIAVTIVCVIFLGVLLAPSVPVLRPAPVQWVGRRSYSLYLVHTVVGYPAIAALSPTIGRDLAMVGATVLTLVVTVAVYELGEVRGTALIRDALLRRRAIGDARRELRRTASTAV